MAWVQQVLGYAEGVSFGTEVKQWFLVEVRLLFWSDQYSLLWTKGIDGHRFLVGPVFGRRKLLYKFTEVGSWRVRLIGVGRLNDVHAFIPFFQIDRRYSQRVCVGSRGFVISLVHTFLSFRNDSWRSVLVCRHLFLGLFGFLFQTLRVVRSWMAASTRVFACTIASFPFSGNVRYRVNHFLACAQERASALAIEVKVENSGVGLVNRWLKLVLGNLSLLGGVVVLYFRSIHAL
jgi:hypothetical protein